MRSLTSSLLVKAVNLSSSFANDRLIEEMEEIKQAKKDGDKAGFLDGIVDLIYIAAGTLYLYDQTAWFTNEFEYPILLTTPCGFMDRFDADGLIVYVKDTEDTHCDRLAQLINYPPDYLVCKQQLAT